LAHEFHHLTTNTALPPPSPITPVGLTSDLTAAGAHHLTTDRLFQSPTRQIDPTSVTPYLQPCYTTIPTTQNRATSEEPPSESPVAGSHRRGRTTVSPLTLLPLPSLACGPTPTTSPLAPCPIAGLPGPTARVDARAPSAGPNSPRGPANQENPFPFLFPILFSYFHIYVYILIFYAPKTVQIFYDTKQ
jgi:hypothetical protein